MTCDMYKQTAPIWIEELFLEVALATAGFDGLEAGSSGGLAGVPVGSLVIVVSEL